MHFIVRCSGGGVLCRGCVRHDIIAMSGIRSVSCRCNPQCRHVIMYSCIHGEHLYKHKMVVNYIVIAVVHV